MTEDTHRNAPDKTQAEPLPTRHVFLDTQAYRAMGYGDTNGLLTQLGERVRDHRVVLHITDVTLREIERHIREEVERRVRDLELARRAVVKLQERAEATRTPFSAIDADALAAAQFDRFRAKLRSLDTEEHSAFDLSPKPVFDLYFARKPPFDQPNAKEFPDAFMLEALRAWCEREDEELVVVTHDKALGRAAKETERLHWIRDVKQILAAAAVEFAPEVDQEVEELLLAQNFDGSYELALEKAVADVPFVYVGDELDDGEAYDGSLSVITAVTEWTPVNLGTRWATVILRTEIEVEVEVGYVDRSEAMYDKEDGIWLGAKSATTMILDVVVASVLTEIDRQDGTVRAATVLNQELEVSSSEPYVY